MTADWVLYLVRCPDGSLYTGITTDLQRRLAAHGTARGARRLRGRQPLELVYSQAVGDRACALRIEHKVKRLSKRDKESLVRGDKPLASLV
jgi:putative endonuclease